MKLRVHFLSRGRYWKAGEEIPDEDVPPNVRKYAVSEDGMSSLGPMKKVRSYKTPGERMYPPGVKSKASQVKRVHCAETVLEIVLRGDGRSTPRPSRFCDDSILPVCRCPARKGTIS